MKTAQKQINHKTNRSPTSAAEDSRQKQSAQFVDNRKEAVAQRALISGIDDSPRMLAQRRRIESYLGITPAQFTGPAPIAESPQQPLQRLEKSGVEETLQPKFASEALVQLERQPASKPNNTGLPDNLKNGIEALSGISMDNVKVHYNSSQPAQLNALAYAQGTDIHVAPGQEQHLPHEAWHVVQQAQGRVQPTTQMKDGVAVNDDKSLEREADVMGERSAGLIYAAEQKNAAPQKNNGVLQAFIIQLFRMTGASTTMLVKNPGDLPGFDNIAPNSRIKIISQDILGLHGANSGPEQWLEIEVTTGPNIGAKGWLQNKNLDAVDQPETTQVTMAVATRLFNELSTAKFTSSTGQEYNIPFSYPIDGCYARAHRMAELLTEKGYASEKSFAVAQSTNRLRVPSKKAGDAPIGTQPVVQWGYHVAPVITLDTGEKYVIDPSMFTTPVPLQTWVSGMGNIADFHQRDLAWLQAQRGAGGIPDENHYYTTPREQYFPTNQGGDLPGNEGSVKWNQTGPAALGRDRLASYAANEEPIHILASRFREIIASPASMSDQLTQLQAIANSMSLVIRQRFAASFPNLLTQLSVIKLGSEIKAIIDGPGTADEKKSLLSPVFHNAKAGLANILKQLYPLLITEMDNAIGSINAVLLRFDWR